VPPPLTTGHNLFSPMFSPPTGPNAAIAAQAPSSLLFSLCHCSRLLYSNSPPLYLSVLFFLDLGLFQG